MVKEWPPLQAKEISDESCVDTAGRRLQEELPISAPLMEGALRVVRVNAYERNAVARQQCIEHHGSACVICGFSFGEIYGSDFDGYIHVHHLKPLSSIGERYVVDPVTDMRPVCPNCHSVIHATDPAKSIDEVRQRIFATNESRKHPKPAHSK